MYQRKRKNDFYKKVEQMIAGREKRPYIDTTNINNDNNNIGNISNDNNNSGTTNINDNSNISNDNSNNISDISNDNRDIGEVNSSPNNNKITLTRWTNVNEKIEGICKFEDKQDKQLLRSKKN